MTPLDLLIILALVGYAIYRQTRRSEVTGAGRFKLAVVYAVAGLCVGGFALPHTAAAAAFLLSGLVLGVVVGVARGRLTRLWRDECDGRVYTQGTAVTIGLFLALVAVKFALGALAYLLHLDDGSGLGEVMVMIALMVGCSHRSCGPAPGRSGRGPPTRSPPRSEAYVPEHSGSAIVSRSGRHRPPRGDLLPRPRRLLLGRSGPDAHPDSTIAPIHGSSSATVVDDAWLQANSRYSRADCKFANAV